MRTLGWSLSLLSVCLIVGGPARVALESQSVSSSETFKVAHYNIQSGMGVTQLSGGCSFQRNQNCTDPSKPMNAWGMGVVQAELDRALNADPSVIALGLAEAWTCASPANVRKALGWASHTGERNGVSLVARYGFAGPAEWLQLDTSLNSNPSDTMWVVRAPVCADAGCSRSVEVFSAHWYAGGTTRVESFERQARQTVEFMDRLPASEPRVLVGDLNVWEEGGLVCNQTPVPTAMQILRDAGNLDAWPSVHGAAEGFTGMWNRNGCGSPNGYLWKRLDQAWSKGLPPPVGMTRFGMITPGSCGPSDHAGIIVEYAWAGIDTTAPTVAITRPAAGATVSGTALVSAIASDDIGVARVGFTIDGAPAAEFTAAPYEFQWNTTTKANGSRTVGAWAQDAAGNRTYAPTVTVQVDNAAPNTPPVASFTRACADLSCTFTDTSTDAEGPIAARAWAFGDGSTSAAQNPVKQYAEAGTYTVSLVVSDSHGATATALQAVTVAAPVAIAPFNFSLSANPSSRSVNPPAKTSYTISSTLVSGAATGVALTVSGLPAATTATFDAPSISTPGSTMMRVNTTKDTPGGTYLLMVTGTGGGLSRSVTVTLVVSSKR